jgi:hypothetical protein
VEQAEAAAGARLAIHYPSGVVDVLGVGHVNVYGEAGVNGNCLFSFRGAA